MLNDAQQLQSAAMPPSQLLQEVEGLCQRLSKLATEVCVMAQIWLSWLYSFLYDLNHRTVVSLCMTPELQAPTDNSNNNSCAATVYQAHACRNISLILPCMMFVT